jgi:mono/diheme cytochrome c family protein
MKKSLAIRLAVGLSPLALALLAGCQQRMAQQPSFRPDEANPFLPTARAQRPLVPGTVARGHLRTDLHLYTGLHSRRALDGPRAAAAIGGAVGSPLAGAALLASETPDFVDTFPFPITREILQHGQDRYMIYCVVCHDPLGTGRGKIVERGYTPPPSFHNERLRAAPVGHFFDVITNGYGSMPDYRQQVPPRDRWAIVAYIRALQLSQHFPEKELTPDMREAMAKPQAAAGGAP